MSLIQQNSSLYFFVFFSPKYILKDMTDEIKHIGQQTSRTVCSVLYLAHQNISHWTKVLTELDTSADY